MVLSKGNDDAGERIRAILRELEAAITNGPAGADVFESHTAPEYIFTSPSGVVSNRSEVLDGLRKGTIRFTSYRMSDIEVRTYGKAAVVFGQAEGEGLNPGGELFEGSYRFTSVWNVQGSDWMLVAWQATAIAS